MIETVRPILESFKTTNFVLGVALSDLTEEVARRRLRPDGGPSIAWTIGHLIHFRIRILNLLGRPRQSIFEETFVKSGATDGHGYPDLQEFWRHWDEVQKELEEVLPTVTAEQLEAPLPGAAHEDPRQVFDVLLFLMWHEAYHVGQIGSLRTHFGLMETSKLAAKQRSKST